MRAFRVKMPSGAGYWTVLDEELSVVPVADAFLRHLRFGRDGAESTTKAYAGAIALFLRWCSRTGRGWQAGAAQLGSFMTWLAHAGPQVSGVEAMPGAEVLAGPGSGHVRGESRINAILTAVRGLVVHAVTEGAAPGHLIRLLFEVADDVDLPEAAWGEDGSTGWRVRARHRLREPDRPVDRASDAGIVALLRACCSARDRLLVLLLARAGLRRGEALGLRRSDVHLLASSRELGCEIPRAHLHVVRRDGNPNGAVAKSRRQRVVPLDFLVVQAFDSYEFERMRVPAAMASDFVFVNLFRGTVGAPMRLDAVNDLVTAAARRAGIGALHPHQMRHAFASNVLDAGGTLDEVQDLLGHATITSTQVYAHPDPARLRTAVHAVPSPAGAGGGRGVSGAAVTARALPEPAGTGRVFEEVLAGVVLHGTAARLAGMIDPLFLAGAGWDPVRRALSFPSEHRLLGRRACRVSGCDSAAHRECPGVCWRCLTWLKGLGMTAEQIAGQRQLPPRPADEELWCAVPGCCRGKASGHSVLCSSHKQQFRRKSSGTLEEFFASPGVGPLGAYETCAVVSCSRPADRHLGYCQAHYARWRQARSAVPGLDARAWERAEPPVAASGRVSLHGLPPLVAVQVLFGLWRRTADDVKTADATLRAACRALACQRAPAIGDCDIGRVRGENVRALIRALARYVRLAMTGPDSERARDLWDLRVFGHRGRLDFTGITQPWLRESVKRWAAQDLPRHRGRGSCEVRNVVNAVTRLSESLSVRPDRGDRPAVGKPVCAARPRGPACHADPA